MDTVIDLSGINPDGINWHTLRAAGVDGAYLKITEGVTFNDPDFATRIVAAHRAGMPVGAYHFARPDNNTAVEEAAHVVRRLHGNRLQLRLALDLEQGTPKPAYDAWAHTFSQEIHRALGYYPVFYSYGPYIEGLKLEQPVGSGLWLAAYGRNDGVEHPFAVPAPWKRAIMHQFSSRCRVAGVQGLVDLSHTSSVSLLAVPAGV